MTIAIRKEQNGIIYIDKTLREDIDYTQPPYNFSLVNVDNIYADCVANDFNEDLTFSFDKYNARKQNENSVRRINELKSLLAKTDYQAIKFAEGELSAEEYLPIKQKRRSYRVEINSLEEKLKNNA